MMQRTSDTHEFREGMFAAKFAAVCMPEYGSHWLYERYIEYNTYIEYTTQDYLPVIDAWQFVRIQRPTCH